MTTNSSVVRDHSAALALPVKPSGGNPAIGAVILSLFGTCWLVMGCASDPRSNSAMVAAIVTCGMVLLGASILVARATKGSSNQESPAQKKHRERVFRNVNIAQWVAIPVMILVLNLVSMTQWIVPGIILVVGLHFIPLARLFGRKELLLAALVFVTIATVGPWLFQGGPTSSLLPIAAGLTLWLNVLFSLRHALRPYA